MSGDGDADADVAIVGGGLAGLYAARELVRRDRSVVVLEARDRLGGRALTRTLRGSPVDLGAQWVGPSQRRIRALLDELGVRTFQQAHEGASLLSIGGRVTRFEDDNPGPTFWSKLELPHCWGRIDKLCKQVPLEAPHRAERAAEWDAITVKSWQDAHVRTHEARVLFDIAVRSVFAVEPRDLSFLHFLFYMHAGGGPRAHIDGAGQGAQSERVLGGVQRVCERLAATLGERGSVSLSSAVSAIDQDASGVRVRADGERAWRARRAIVALPPALAARIRYEPSVTPARDALMQRMPMGSVIKCVLAYDRPFWRDDGLSGEVFADSSALSLAFDHGAHDGSEAALAVFLLGDSAREWTARPEERKRAVVSELTRLFGERAGRPIDFVDHDWPADPWSRGGYAGWMAPGTYLSVGGALREPCGRIHWSGTETAIGWAGYLDGAIESGERAAREVEARLHTVP